MVKPQFREGRNGKKGRIYQREPNPTCNRRLLQGGHFVHHRWGSPVKGVRRKKALGDLLNGGKEADLAGGDDSRRNERGAEKKNTRPNRFKKRKHRE